MKILIATHNPGKQKELVLGLKNLDAELVTLDDLNIKTEPEETGKTFEENSLIKAFYYSELSNLPTVADDGGVAIEALKGEPGVKSRMWLGREASDEELINHTLEKLAGFPKERRRAYFETCICFYNPKNKKHLIEKERISGYMDDKTSGRRVKGYPFRSIFIVDGFNKYYDALTDEEHAKINHRLKALKRLSNKIARDLLK